MADRKWDNPVRSQMGGKVPSMTPSGKKMDAMEAPFGKAHDTGKGGIPVVMYDTMGSPGVGSKITPSQVGGMAAVPASGPSRGREKASAPGNKK